MASFERMKQATLDLNLNVRKTRKQVFLDQMDKVVPWDELVDLIAPYHSEGKTGRAPPWMPHSLRHPVRPRTKAKRVTPTCTPAKKATSGTLA
jgi:IS5 family transposase